MPKWIPVVLVVLASKHAIPLGYCCFIAAVVVVV